MSGNSKEFCSSKLRIVFTAKIPQLQKNQYLWPNNNIYGTIFVRYDFFSSILFAVSFMKIVEIAAKI